jgi:hypothetical protein
MPTRDKAPIGSPCWVDLWTSDTESSRSFYASLFGWEALGPAAEFGGYFMFTRNGVPIAGGMGDMGDMSADNTWKVYLASDDAANTAEAAEAKGAKVVAPPMSVANLGAQAVLVDPTGAVIGIWEPRAFAGLTVLSEHGAPSWFELHTGNYKVAVDFYRSVFHWETDTMGDSDNSRYTTMRDPEGSPGLAGIMDASAHIAEGGHSAWVVYFGADDTDAVLAQAESLGGSVVRAADDTPYGRLAIAADPSGAQFSLLGPNKAAPAQAS